MDNSHFDALVKVLRTSRPTSPRRRLLAGLLGTALAAPLSWLEPRSTTAANACKTTGKPCKKPGQCCSGSCVGGTGTGSTARSAGVCGEAGQQFNCRCWDLERRSPCRPAACTQDNLFAICDEVCAATGGTFSTSCTTGTVCRL